MAIRREGRPVHDRRNGRQAPVPRPVRYRESDGKPMGETGIHVEALVRLLQILWDAFAQRPDVYIIGNMFVYYEEGNPRASVAPDAFVVFGVPKHPQRRIYKVWEEGAVPAFVMEITSASFVVAFGSGRREDQVKKRALCARLGVREYFLFDPLAEYLHPPLQGFRLDNGEYQAIPADAGGAIVSETLGLRFMVLDGELRLFDQQTAGCCSLPPSAPSRPSSAWPSWRRCCGNASSGEFGNEGRRDGDPAQARARLPTGQRGALSLQRW